MLKDVTNTLHAYFPPLYHQANVSVRKCGTELLCEMEACHISTCVPQMMKLKLLFYFRMDLLTLRRLYQNSLCRFMASEEEKRGCKLGSKYPPIKK